MLFLQGPDELEHVMTLLDGLLDHTHVRVLVPYRYTVCRYVHRYMNMYVGFCVCW